MNPDNVEKDDVKTVVANMKQVLPSIRAVDTENGPRLIVEAFGVQRWFNPGYLNKVFEDVEMKVVSDTDSSVDSDSGVMP